MFDQRMNRLREKLADAGADLALITDEDSVYYFTGYYDYLHMDFGRPTILAVAAQGDSVLITPAMELDMAQAAARVDRIAPWNDGVGQEWRAALQEILGAARVIAIEPQLMPPVVRTYIDQHMDQDALRDAVALIAELRMVKSEEELRLARHAGEVAMAMMHAARQTIGDGVREFEVALATSAAGTRKAAELLEAHYQDSAMSPNTHFLQIMASGDQITKSHHRASIRQMRHGEPVFMCFCGMTNFHRFKLGFDRTFWIGEISDPRQAELYEIAVASQRAALETLRPGVTAETVHAAYAQVIQEAGFDYPFRCGRATGYSFLEQPQLVTGDKTVLQPGMVLAVDGSVLEANRFRAQVGDSFIITQDGYEQITHHPKSLEEVTV